MPVLSIRQSVSETPESFLPVPSKLCSHSHQSISYGTNKAILLNAQTHFPITTWFSVPSLVKTPLPPWDILGSLVLCFHGCWKIGTTLHVHPSHPAQWIQKAFASGWVDWWCSLPFLLSLAKVLVKCKAFYTRQVVYGCCWFWSLNGSTWVFTCHHSVDSAPLSARMRDVLCYLLFRRHPLAL